METNDSFEQPEPGLVLNLEAQGFLRAAGRWANFLGIMGFIGSGIILIIALFISTIFSALATYNPAAAALPAAMGGVIAFVYVLIAVFNFFFALYLFQFGSKVKKGLLYTDETELTTALGKLKSFFKLWGITTIVIIGLYVLIIIIAVVAGIGAASMMNR